MAGKKQDLGTTPSTAPQAPRISLSPKSPTSQVDSQSSAGRADEQYRSHFPAPPTDKTLHYDAQGAEGAQDHHATFLATGVASTNILFSSTQSTFEQFRKKAFRTTILPKLSEEGEAEPQLLLEEQERYEKARRLGEGAMGDVELVHDKDINRFVAVKRLKPALHDPTTLLRFAEEVRTVGQLEHPNIIPIHDVGLDANGQYYFVMKYIEGQTLEDIIKKLRIGDKETHERYNFTVRVQVFYDILKALEFAHAKGILHRDIKPANIMVGAHGEVVVMDWGIAKQLSPSQSNEIGEVSTPSSSLLDQLQQDPAYQGDFARYETKSGVLMGTPAYMSPEQASALNTMLDQRSDIYSLCVLFYEWMTLHHYMEHKQNLHDLLFGIVVEAPKTPFGMRNPYQPTVPIEISHFISKGLSKAPADRYQSVEEMQRTLENIRGGYFKIQCPTTLTKRVLFSMIHVIDRLPWLAYLLVVALLALLANLLLTPLLGLIGL